MARVFVDFTGMITYWAAITYFLINLSQIPGRGVVQGPGDTHLIAASEIECNRAEEAGTKASKKKANDTSRHKSGGSTLVREHQRPWSDASLPHAGHTRLGLTCNTPVTRLWDCLVTPASRTTRLTDVGRVTLIRAPRPVTEHECLRGDLVNKLYNTQNYIRINPSYIQGF